MDDGDVEALESKLLIYLGDILPGYEGCHFGEALFRLLLVELAELDLIDVFGFKFELVGLFESKLLDLLGDPKLLLIVPVRAVDEVVTVWFGIGEEADKGVLISSAFSALSEFELLAL